MQISISGNVNLHVSGHAKCWVDVHLNLSSDRQVQYAQCGQHSLYCSERHGWRHHIRQLNLPSIVQSGILCPATKTLEYRIVSNNVVTKQWNICITSYLSKSSALVNTVYAHVIPLLHIQAFSKHYTSQYVIWLIYITLSFSKVRSNKIPLFCSLFKCFGGHVLLWGHWYPCFGFLVMFPLGFRIRVCSALLTLQRQM